MDKQTTYICAATVIGFIFGRIQTTTSSLIYLGIFCGVVYALYTYG